MAQTGRLSHRYWKFHDLHNAGGFSCYFFGGAPRPTKQQLNPTAWHKAEDSHIGGSGDRFDPYRWISRTNRCSCVRLSEGCVSQPGPRDTERLKFPVGRFCCFPDENPAKIQPGRPIPGPEAQLRNRRSAHPDVAPHLMREICKPGPSDTERAKFPKRSSMLSDIQSGGK